MQSLENHKMNVSFLNVTQYNVVVPKLTYCI